MSALTVWVHLNRKLTYFLSYFMLFPFHKIMKSNFLIFRLYHRKLKQLQQAQTIITNTIICTVCGGTGHIAQDCKEKK